MAKRVPLSGRESMLSTLDSICSAFLDETNGRVQTYCSASQGKL